MGRPHIRPCAGCRGRTPATVCSRRCATGRPDGSTSCGSRCARGDRLVDGSRVHQGRLVPAGRQERRGGAVAVLRRAVPDGRGQRDLLRPSDHRDRRGVGRAHAAGIPVPRQGAPGHLGPSQRSVAAAGAVAVPPRRTGRQGPHPQTQSRTAGRRHRHVARILRPARRQARCNPRAAATVRDLRRAPARGTRPDSGAAQALPSRGGIPSSLVGRARRA